MGKLLEEIRLQSKRSKVDELILGLGAEGQDLLEASKDPSIPASRIREVLMGRGLKVACSTLSLWRRDHGVA